MKSPAKLLLMYLNALPVLLHLTKVIRFQNNMEAFIAGQAKESEKSEELLSGIPFLIEALADDSLTEASAIEMDTSWVNQTDASNAIKTRFQNITSEGGRPDEEIDLNPSKRSS